jgi:hypothetical protein
MIEAKPVSLNVRPFQVSNLCFQAGGILGESFTELGAKISAFDFSRIYNAFREANAKAARNDGRVPLDSDGIDAATKTSPNRFALGALRAEAAKSSLNKAINQRANAFITKYANATGIASALKASASVKTLRLTRLAARSQQRTDKLLFAYQHSGRDVTDVVTTTITDIVAKRHEGAFLTTTKVIDEKTTTSRAPHEFLVSANQVKDNDLAEAVEIQKVENTGYEFRMPFIEEDMRNDRDQIMIGDQFDSNFLQTHYLDRLEEVYKNELASIDADINQWQVAYLDTILLSPIDGIVTGVYKNPGDSVGAGEPVFRVEDNSEVLLIANVICRGSIAIGSKLKVSTPVFDSPASRVTLEALIVSARGQRDNDHWEVIAKCSNLDADGKIIFPLGYNFDYDNTDVNILGADDN